jgi:hypothetical protein
MSDLTYVYAITAIVDRSEYTLGIFPSEEDALIAFRTRLPEVMQEVGLRPGDVDSYTVQRWTLGYFTIPPYSATRMSLDHTGRVIEKYELYSDKVKEHSDTSRGARLKSRFRLEKPAGIVDEN